MSTSNKLFIDIETLPPQGGEHLARIRAGIRPPAQYKKADSIAQWLADNGDAAAAEEFGRLGLNGLYGEVACLCFAVGDGPVFSHAQVGDQSEAAVLREAFAAIDHAATDNNGHVRPLVAVGHNVTDFDLRFLFHRAVRHGIRLPLCLKSTYASGGRHDVYDTMREWSGYRGFVGLKDLAGELLGDTCDDIDGSEVAGIWQTEPMRVIEHCRRDVDRVRGLYRLMTAVAA